MIQAHAEQTRPVRLNSRFQYRILIFILALLPVLFSLLSGQAAASDSAPDIPAYSARDNGCPYYICVNRAANTVTIYTTDESGYYTIPVKAMVCSTGREGHATPKGTFAITGVKKTWCYMVDGTYGQYSSQFRGNYLFHSICYKKANPATMLTDEYNMLGGRASRGCVRLQVIDAKWIYDNCKAGTKVTIYDDETYPGPLGKPLPALDFITPEMDNGWDPTDPRENNPWKNQIITDFTIIEDSVQIESGFKKNLTHVSEPPEAVLPRISWTSSDPSVAIVNDDGQVIALNAGNAVITGARGDFSDTCEITVTGDLLPFEDIPAGMWNYREIKYIYQNHIIDGLNETTFSPDGYFTWADAIQALYRLAGNNNINNNITPAAPERAWYHDALDWAREYSLIGIANDETFEPGRAISRQDFALLLYRYDTIYLGYSGKSEISLESYPDAQNLDWEAAAALRWMLNYQIMAGTPEGNLNPGDLTTRSHAAVFFYRYGQIGHTQRQFRNLETLLLRQKSNLLPILPAAPGTGRLSART